MTEARNLSELADRVENLTGPDRELDYEIWCALTEDTTYWSLHKWANGKYSLRYWPGGPEPQYPTLPRYTASLDAAMTLAIPTHHIIGIEELPRDWTVKIGSRSNDREPVSWAECGSLPCAITSAWLQARARAQGEG